MGIEDEVRARRLGGVALSAQTVFTNRYAEQTIFDLKQAEMSALRHAKPELALDLAEPRRNVLCFYGVGGIGKTSLSVELERRFREPTTGISGRRHTARIDFADPGSRDGEVFLLALRAGLSDVARAFPAFDTALGIYWERQHPGASVVDFVRSQSSVGRARRREALVEHLQDFSQSILDSGGLVLGGAGRALRFAWRTVRESTVVRALERDCPFFESCVSESDLDTMRLHLPLLLAWDLSRAGGDLDVAIFLDTFERVTSDGRVSRLGGFEDAVARAVFFLPTVLFVVTTRNHLDWASPDRRISLEFAGSDCWPGLSALDENSDQHLVGMLSIDDCRQHLDSCLVNSEGTPAIPKDLRDAIADLSDGLPLYLDVAANRFLVLAARNIAPSIEDFSRGIPELVTRLMEDLDDDETDLLRVAALLGVFDRSTLRAVLAQARASTIERFLARSLVVKREDGFFSIHELLRTSVRLQDRFTTNYWSPDDWLTAEKRLVDHWSAKFADSEAELWRDRGLQALAFWQLFGVAATGQSAVDVLPDVVMRVQLVGVWSTIEAALDQPPSLLTPRGEALLLLIEGMMQRQVGNLAAAVDALQAVVDRRDELGDASRLAEYYLGEALDLRGGDSVSIFARLATGDDRLAVEARIALGHSLARDGDLLGALEIACATDLNVNDPEFGYRVHELLGVILWSGGQFAESAGHFHATSEFAADVGSPLLTALSLRHICLALCWSEPAGALSLLQRAETMNADLGMTVGVAQCLQSRAIALIGRAGMGEIDELLSAAEDAFLSGGYLDDALGPLATGVFAAQVAGNRDLAIERRLHLLELSQGRRPRHWLALADLCTGHQHHLQRVRWPEDPQTAVDRWRSVINQRQARQL